MNSSREIVGARTPVHRPTTRGHQCGRAHIRRAGLVSLPPSISHHSPFTPNLERFGPVICCRSCSPLSPSARACAHLAHRPPHAQSAVAIFDLAAEHRSPPAWPPPRVLGDRPSRPSVSKSPPAAAPERRPRVRATGSWPLRHIVTLPAAARQRACHVAATHSPVADGATPASALGATPRVTTGLIEEARVSRLLDVLRCASVRAGRAHAAGMAVGETGATRRLLLSPPPPPTAHFHSRRRRGCPLASP